MINDRIQFFSQRFLPGRLTVVEAAWHLGFGEHDIYVLVAHQMLAPLGNPVQNCTKYFAISDLEKVRIDRKWNDRATALLTHHWRIKNHRPIKPNSLLNIRAPIRKRPKPRRKSRPKRP